VAVDGALRLRWLPIEGDASSKFGGAYASLRHGGKRTGGFAGVDSALSAYLDTRAWARGIEYGAGEVTVHLHDLIDGDADLSGRVDRSDFLALRGGFGSAGTDWSRGDFTFDAAVDAFDYIALKRHCGDVVPVGGIVPEPSALVLLAGGVLLTALRRRRSR
jgi:hypothetical protein